MKTKLFFAAFFAALVLTSMRVEAQSVTPFVQEGKQWNYKTVPSAPFGWEGTTYNKMAGDTLLNDKSYKKLWWWTNNPDSEAMLSNSFYRQEGDKVYVAKPEGEALFFDFGAQVGDVLELQDSEYNAPDTYSVEITWIGDTTLFYDEQHEPMTTRYFKLNCENFLETIFYENIGMISQATVQNTYFCDFLVGALIDLLCVKVNDETLCYVDGFSCEHPFNWVEVEEQHKVPAITCYPNPFTDELKIETSLTAALVEICDAAGRLLYSAFHEGASATIDTESLPKGMYILRVENENQNYNQKIIKQ